MRWESIIKKAKSCHSKQTWESFFHEFGSFISRTTNSKPISELYTLIAADSNCLKYQENIWISLLSGCLSSWDFGLGRKIAQSTASIPSPQIRAKAAEIYLESGQPIMARKIASTGLRLKKTSSVDLITLKLIVCKSYAEDGSHTTAKRMLKNLETTVCTKQGLSSSQKADMFISMGRSKFFLGHYTDAAIQFSRAFSLYMSLERWEAASSALYNSAACYDNSGIEYKDRALELVGICESLSITHSAFGPLSHCHAFHGNHFYNHGQFNQAIQCYLKSLQLMPRTEKGFRKLHILSMMTLTYLKAGNYQKAKKYGDETLKLARKDQSERFKIRYLSLKSELLWQSGKINQSYQLLEEKIKPLAQKGLYTLEELTGFSRFLVRSAQLDLSLDLNIKVAKNLKGHKPSWLEYLLGLGYQYVTKKNYGQAYQLAKDVIHYSKQYGFKFYEAQGHSLVALTKITQCHWDEEFYRAVGFLNQLSSLREYKVFLSQYCILSAAQAYRDGEFHLIKTYLSSAKKDSTLPFHKAVIIDIWNATMEGHSPKIQNKWHLKFLISATKLYFSPSIQSMGNSHYIVSKHYTVSLESYPVLNKLFQYLLKKRDLSASPEELQQNVWNQSIQQTGWDQKIRNAIVRLRSLFPHTLAPIVIYSDHKIRLFHEAIDFHLKNSMTSRDSENKILTLLKKGPQSSLQIANNIDVSQSTTKRILKKLVLSQKVQTKKVGRKVFYHGLPFDYCGHENESGLSKSMTS